MGGKERFTKKEKIGLQKEKAPLRGFFEASLERNFSEDNISICQYD